MGRQAELVQPAGDAVLVGPNQSTPTVYLRPTLVDARDLSGPGHLRSILDKAIAALDRCDEAATRKLLEQAKDTLAGLVAKGKIGDDDAMQIGRDIDYVLGYLT